MKESKEKAILPCYSDDTHDKVYELNKQMCDLGKTILTKKKNDMTEKKTKKMTKAEILHKICLGSFFKKKEFTHMFIAFGDFIPSPPLQKKII